MAVQAQFGGLAGRLPCCGGGLAEEQMRGLRDYGGALLSAAAANNGCQYNCAPGVVSGCGVGGVVASRKRGREVDLEQYVLSSSVALLPIPGMHKAVAVAQQSPAAIASRMVESALTSTSGRPTSAASVADALVSELCQQGAKIDALVRVECERLRAGLEQARKRQCQAVVRAAVAGAARILREKEAELEVTRCRAADLVERLRQAAVESQAWCGLARNNEAVAARLRASLDTLLRAAGGSPAPAEGFGDSDLASCPVAAADDAQSCCFVEAKDTPTDNTAAAMSPVNKWACKACGEGEASVLLLPCRHLCLCKACEPRMDSCPVCLAAKNASIHIAAN